ncbi:MAG TPA: DinB family protein, partial [Planctomycetota bacterium]
MAQAARERLEGQVERLRALYPLVRRRTEELCAPLRVEDLVVQSMPDASPAKWHLAHTSWFFETFVLRPAVAGYRLFHPAYPALFNSYYESAGARHPRPERGRLSRPTVAEVRAYRAHVDGWMTALLAGEHAALDAERAFTIELGLNHEEQHQELLLTDVKHLLGTQPLRPAYRELAPPARPPAPGAEPPG